ncbi:Holliday junction branch migration protein RuvA [Bacteroidota bacterium]
MFDFISGDVIESNPAFVIIENKGIGYFVHISVNTYSKIQHATQYKLYIQQVIREDAHLLYGFAEKSERELFRNLISVSGIGANTARMMLSSITTQELQTAIIHENINLIKSIKGIGTKTAQRVIIELKDKLIKAELSEELIPSSDNTLKEEALSALVMLGFNKKPSEKVVNELLRENKEITVEELIKKALKVL